MSSTCSVPTFCRICEAACGLVADVRDQEVVGLRPDPDHPLSRGFACVKGVAYREVHHSSDRVTQPLKRVGDRFEPVSWEVALSEIAEKLRRIRSQHGPEGVGLYLGNPVAFNVPHVLFTKGLTDALGTHHVYGAGSQDCNNKFVAALEMYGAELVQPMPDLDRTRCLILLGSNPAVSQMTFVNAPRVVERLRAIERAGGHVVNVNPRRTETARQVGEQLFIRPGTDVFFLLSFAHALFARDGADASVAQHLEHREALEQAVRAWPAERTAPVTGVPAERLHDLVERYLAADGAALYAATGVNQGPHGTLAFWILSAINAVSGNLDRPGSTLVARGLPWLSARFGAPSAMHVSRIGGFDSVMETLPAGVLADEILTPGKGQLRAMIVSAGNPLLTCGNGARLGRAFRELELLVSVDLFRNETGNLAHYVLPATSFFEREDVPTAAFIGQPVPYVQYTAPLVSPRGEAKDEWWIYTRLLHAMGLRMFGLAHRYLLWSTGSGWWRRMLGFSPRRLLSLMTLGLLGRRIGSLSRRHPHGVRTGRDWAGSFLGRWVPRPGGKVDLAPARFVAAMPALEAAFAREQADAGGLRMITKRERHSHNSWLHNVDTLVAGKRGTNHLHVHPDDARRLGLAAGQRASVRTAQGRIELPVTLTDDLMPGVVAVPHGWGHQEADGLQVARKTGGANVNHLTPDGPDSLERFAGMTHLTGLPVEVEPVDAAPPARR